MNEWCRRVQDAAGIVWRFLRVNQSDFHKLAPGSRTLQALITHVLGNACADADQ